MQVSRRHFLTARRPSAPPPFRPPWALAEAAFAAACTRCGDCVAACPSRLLRSGDGGYPVADFTPSRAAACDFCGACRAACATGALAAAQPWTLRAEVGSACLTHAGVVCRTCGESCPSGAIAFPPRLGGVARPLVDAACTGCAACLADCPSQALRIVRPAAPSLSVLPPGAA